MSIVSSVENAADRLRLWQKWGGRQEDAFSLQAPALHFRWFCDLAQLPPESPDPLIPTLECTLYPFLCLFLYISPIFTTSITEKYSPGPQIILAGLTAQCSPLSAFPSLHSRAHLRAPLATQARRTPD